MRTKIDLLFVAVGLERFGDTKDGLIASQYMHLFRRLLRDLTS